MSASSYTVEAGGIVINIISTAEGDILSADILSVGTLSVRESMKIFDGKKLLVCATSLREAVWRELMNTRYGERISYSELAQRVGRPKAVRAVASAVAANRIALAIPCHRIVRADGSTGQFRWGNDVKRRLLASESTPSEQKE